MLLTKPFAALLMAAMAFAPSYVAAQEEQRRDNQSGDATSNAQVQRSQTDQAERSSYQNDQNQSGVPLKQAIADKMHMANNAEIELAKMAQEKSDHAELKKLTQQIISDHQELNQKLAQHTGKENWSDKDRTSQGAASNQPNGSQAQQNNALPGNPVQPDGQSASQPTTNPANLGQQSPGQDSAKTQLASQSDSSVMVPQKLCEIAKKAGEKNLSMTKEMLSQHDGQDFAMAFLGQQCVMHTMALAELEALESSGPEELKSYVQEARKVVKDHLEQSKQLAKKLEDDRSKNQG